MINWSKYFDAIYCIHYLPFKDRVDRITDELKRVGILDSGIFKWKYTFDSPFYNNLLHSDIRLYHDTLRNPSMLKCTLAHYEICKEAQGLEYKRILVIEDDVVFLKDLNKLSFLLETMPLTYDVCMLDYFPFSADSLNFYKTNRRINDDYAEFDGYMSSGALYSLSDKGLEFVINRQEESLHAGDTAWHKEFADRVDLKRCFSIKQLGYQKQYNSSYTNNSGGRGMMEYHYSMSGLNPEEYS